MASLLLEGALAGLLIATIVYAAMLDRRLRTLRQSRDEMQALLASFTAATAHAQSGIVALRETSQNTAQGLQSEIERAKALRDDLNFLLDRGNSLADRLEGDVGAARAAVKATSPRSKPDAAKSEAPKPADSQPVVRLSDTPKRVAAPHSGMPGANLQAKRMAATADGDDDMARELLRALKTAR